jgi:hypothetical protein
MTIAAAKPLRVASEFRVCTGKHVFLFSPNQEKNNTIFKEKRSMAKLDHLDQVLNLLCYYYCKEFKQNSETEIN